MRARLPSGCLVFSLVLGAASSSAAVPSGERAGDSGQPVAASVAPVRAVDNVEADAPSSAAPTEGAIGAAAPPAVERTPWALYGVLGGAVLAIGGAGVWLGADTYLTGALTRRERELGEDVGVAGVFATGLGVVVIGIGTYAWMVDG